MHASEAASRAEQFTGLSRIPTPRAPDPPIWPNRRAAIVLWTRLGRARIDGDRVRLAEAEQAVFRFYLPLAHGIARSKGRKVEPAHDRTCAERGLNKALHSCRVPDEAWFEEYAHRAIEAELRY